MGNIARMDHSCRTFEIGSEGSFRPQKGGQTVAKRGQICFCFFGDHPKRQSEYCLIGIFYKTMYKRQCLIGIILKSQKGGQVSRKRGQKGGLGGQGPKRRAKGGHEKGAPPPNKWAVRQLCVGTCSDLPLQLLARNPFFQNDRPGPPLPPPPPLTAHIIGFIFKTFTEVYQNS